MFVGIHVCMNVCMFVGIYVFMCVWCVFVYTYTVCEGCIWKIKVDNGVFPDHTLFVETVFFAEPRAPGFQANLGSQFVWLR